MELNIDPSETQRMATQLREGIVKVVLSGEVEFDEVYVVVGHKGNPVTEADEGREGRRNRLKGARVA